MIDSNPISKMCGIFKCGTLSYRNAALVVAIVDIILFSSFLVLFILGSSLLVSFSFTGNAENATRVLDEITDGVFDTKNVTYSTRQSKDVIEDTGVFLILTLLVIADFVVSCVFLYGVKQWNAVKCQIWLDIRVVTVIIFLIVVIINQINGSTWSRIIPDALFTVYRIFGICIGYLFLRELHEVGNLCKYCRKNVNQRTSVNLSDGRNEVKRELREMPIVIITGPSDEATYNALADISPPFYLAQKSSVQESRNESLPEFILGKGGSSPKSFST